MKKLIAVILCVTILLSALCCACAKDENEKSDGKLAEELLSGMLDAENLLSGGETGKTDEEQRQEVVLRFLEAIFLTDPAGVASCVPEELQIWAYESCMNQRWHGKSVDITLYEVGRVDTLSQYADILEYAVDYYQDRAGYTLSADEVWGYGFEYTIEWDDGDTETDGGAYGMLAVLIDGTWYAIPAA